MFALIGVFVVIAGLAFMLSKMYIIVAYVPKMNEEGEYIDPMKFYKELKENSLARQIGRGTLFLVGAIISMGIGLMILEIFI